jgi:hypothetical protein
MIVVPACAFELPSKTALGFGIFGPDDIQGDSFNHGKGLSTLSLSLTVIVFS